VAAVALCGTFGASFALRATLIAIVRSAEEGSRAVFSALTVKGVHGVGTDSAVFA